VTVRALLLALPIVLAACDVPDLDRDPFVQLGTGEVEFVPLEEGDDVGVVHGIQGGDHIWGSARATGVDWRELSMRWELLDDEDGQPLSEPSLLITSMVQCPVSDAGCSRGMGETVGFPVLVDDVGDVVSDDVIMKITIEDAEGRSATDEYVVDPVRVIE